MWRQILTAATVISACSGPAKNGWREKPICWMTKSTQPSIGLSSQTHIMATNTLDSR